MLIILCKDQPKYWLSFANCYCGKWSKSRWWS